MDEIQEVQAKWWLDSTTIRQALITYIPAIIIIANLFGVDIKESELTTIAAGIAGLVSLVATTLTIVNRFKVDKQPAKVTLEKPS